MFSLLCSNFRYRHEIVADETKIYMFGGGKVLVVNGFETLCSFCGISLVEWVRIGETAGSGRRRGQVGLNVYNMTGGYDGAQIFGDIWRIHLPTMSWVKYDAEISILSYFHSTAVMPLLLECLHMPSTAISSELV
ncbi:PREDICTED: kelch domain-containing protein 10-like [Priapulus caudatus]|uniref:Kelch domain-containing protein 10-like n=1 Tax=Priapulus caudatus TaxID=37621 RepID=A0ABM1E1E5_PRICU|nr:PREDICTED: kelch domain-containing protein 10-like [Priapulus caudatus]